MDEKTRNNFELNIWNPRTMTDNQIYETCDDAMGSENHYCTPISSRNSGIVRSTTALVPTMEKNPIYRHGISKKAALVTASIVTAAVLVLVVLVCSVFALVELQRVQAELVNLKGDIEVLRESQRNDVESVRLAISQERENREIQLTNIGTAVNTSVSDLSDSAQANISYLQSSLSTDISILKEMLAGNLSAVASMFSVQYMDLTLTLNSSFTNLSSEFNNFQTQYWIDMQNIKDNLFTHSSSINSTNYAILLLQQEAQEYIQSLNSTFGSVINSVRDEISLTNDTLHIIMDSILNSTSARIAELRSVHAAAVGRLEDFISRNVSSLEGLVEQSDLYLMGNISTLQSSVSATVSSFQSVVNASISSLRSELVFVEFELSIATHSNITNLGNEVQEKLDELVGIVRENVTYLERLMDERILNLFNVTQQNLSALQMETHSNLSEVERLAQHEISSALNLSITSLNQLEIDLQRNLSVLTTEIRSNEYNFEIQINTTINMLENRIFQSRAETSESINNLWNEVRLNVTDLYVTLISINSSLGTELQRVQADLAIETHSNISRLASDISVMISSTENALLGNVTHLELTVGNLSGKIDQQFSDLQMQFQASVSSVLEAVVNNLSTVENQTVTSLDLLRLEIQGNVSMLRLETAQELADVSSRLEYNIATLSNTTTDRIKELQRADHMMAELVGELMVKFAQNLSDLHLSILSNISTLETDLRLGLAVLNRTDMLLLTRIMDAERGLHNIEERSNETVKVVMEIEDDIANLSRHISSNQNNISQLEENLTALESSLLSMEILFNSSVLRFTLDIGNLSEESERNFTHLNNYSRFIDARLNSSIQELEFDLQNVELNLSSVGTQLSTTASDLQNNIVGNISTLRTEVRYNIIESEDRLAELATQINESLVVRLEEQSNLTQHSIAMSMQQLAHDINVLFNYVNSSIEILNSDDEVLSASIRNVSMLLNSTIHDLSIFGSNLELTRNQLLILIHNSTMETQDSLNVINHMILVNAESAMNTSLQLQGSFEKNLSSLNARLSSSIQQLESSTWEHTSQLNSSLSELSSTTTQSSRDLGNTIQLVSTLLNAKIANLTAEMEEGISELAVSVNKNFTSLSTQLAVLSTSSNIAHSNLNQSIMANQQATDSSLSTLNFSLDNLTQSVVQLENNVSSVGNEVEMLKDSYEDFSNSSLSLYDNCIEDSAECTLNPDRLSYSSGCTTSSMPVNITGFYTIDTKCEYQSSSMVDTIKSQSIIPQNGGKVSCQCSIVAIGLNSNSHTVVWTRNDPASVTRKCTLKIVRCPTSINLR